MLEYAEKLTHGDLTGGLPHQVGHRDRYIPILLPMVRGRLHACEETDGKGASPARISSGMHTPKFPNPLQSPYLLTQVLIVARPSPHAIPTERLIAESILLLPTTI